HEESHVKEPGVAPRFRSMCHAIPATRKDHETENALPEPPWGELLFLRALALFASDRLLTLILFGNRRTDQSPALAAQVAAIRVGSGLESLLTVATVDALQVGHTSFLPLARVRC